VLRARPPLALNTSAIAPPHTDVSASMQGFSGQAREGQGGGLGVNGREGPIDRLELPRDSRGSRQLRVRCCQRIDGRTDQRSP